MPELPEVETVRRGLEPVLAGRVLERATILDGRLTAPDDPLAVALELDGEHFLAVDRRGKYLLFRFQTGRILVCHLRMTGNFLYASGAVPGPGNLRATWELDDGALVFYADQRRFGTWRLVEPGGLDDYLRLRAGPEPLDGDWTAEHLRAATRRRRAPVKALLLDQLVVAGVGNIYADEALWEARVHPLRPGERLDMPAVRRLHDAVIAVLERGIAAQGASIRNYRGADGASGSMQERFAVYGRDGLPCLRCGTPIAKIRVAGRGTHFCPRCTRRPR
ncbi:MAG TPA: bifunctional DNA-formamidopyrimidine glycosylase/DNA-(apurinic or apyrimidinic site) lyase [Gaiellales bacterium]|jgi:formamidopyrimidine-DNA glycosylase|nr:bifunctional DNA-formamidopyrimidine glycosylase/DNA-(apurinic or apyrimidinic site) lyase [Gaiellales bacterium]